MTDDEMTRQRVEKLKNDGVPTNRIRVILQGERVLAALEGAESVEDIKRALQPVVAKIYGIPKHKEPPHDR